MAVTTSSAVMSELPREVMECVMSFLSVPSLCRMRAVCKGWNDLICSPSFRDLYEKKTQLHRREVCFLRSFKARGCFSAFDPTTCFLDLEERRWYTIKGAETTGYDTRILAMDNLLVAELRCEDEEAARDNGNHVPAILGVETLDPVSKFSFRIEPPLRVCPPDQDFPTLVVAAGDAPRNFKVFLIDNSGNRETGRAQFLRIYESSASRDPGVWRTASYPPNLKWDNAPARPRMTPVINPITKARSAVFFRGGLYVIVSPWTCEDCFLYKYDCENDTWTMILEEVPRAPAFTFDMNLQLKRLPAHAQLLVVDNRLYMWYWSFERMTYGRGKLCAPLEILEVLIHRCEETDEPEELLRTVLQITDERIQHIFGEPVDDLAGMFPRMSSDGSCSSVVLVSASTGSVIDYNVVSGSAVKLPAHPLGRAGLLQVDCGRRFYRRFWAAVEELSLKKVLPTSPVSP